MLVPPDAMVAAGPLDFVQVYVLIVPSASVADALIVIEEVGSIMV